MNGVFNEISNKDIEKIFMKLINKQNNDRFWTITNIKCDYQFIRLSLSNKDHSIVTNDNNEEIIDISMELDNTIINNNSNIYGTVDICVNPVFKIPTPYLMVWNQSGSYLSTDDIQSLLDIPNRDITIDLKDNRIHPFGKLISEDNPLTYQVSTSIHVCEIANIFNSLTINNKEDYILAWLSLIGPHIGLSISPKEFIEIKQLF